VKKEELEESCPDILGTLTRAKKRFERDGVQFIGSISPGTIAAGERAYLILYLQNTLDVPVGITVMVKVPSRAFISRSHLDAPRETVIQMGPAEVGILKIPIQTSPETPSFDYDIEMEIKARALGKGRRIRPKKGVGYSGIGKSILKSVIGLGLAATIGIGFVSVPTKRLKVGLTVTEEKRYVEHEELKYSYTPIWTVKDWEIWKKARVMLSDKREQIITQLKSSTILETLKQMLISLFSECRMDLFDSEAVFMTITIYHWSTLIFEEEKVQQAILLPVFEKALREGRIPNDLTSPFVKYMKNNFLLLMKWALLMSYARLFSKNKLMPEDEWRKITNRVIDLLSKRKQIPVDDIYYPLIAPLGILLAERKMKKNELRRSLNSLIEAKDKRANQFTIKDVRETVDFTINHVMKKMQEEDPLA